MFTIKFDLFHFVSTLDFESNEGYPILKFKAGESPMIKKKKKNRKTIDICYCHTGIRMEAFIKQQRWIFISFLQSNSEDGPYMLSSLANIRT